MYFENSVVSTFFSEKINENYYINNLKRRLFFLNKKKDISLSFFEQGFNYEKNIYRSRKKYKLSDYYCSFNVFEIFILIIEILTKQNIFNSNKKLIDFDKIQPSQSWLYDYKNLSKFYKKPIKHLSLIKRKNSFYFYYGIFHEQFNTSRRAINNYGLIYTNNMILDQNSIFCNIFFKTVMGNEFKNANNVRGILNKISPENISLDFITSVSNLFVPKILLLEIFEKIKKDFIYFKLYSKICSIVVRGLDCHIYLLNFILLFLNFQHKEEFEKLGNREQLFGNESLNDFSFKNFFFKKTVKMLFFLSKYENFSKIEFFFSNLNRKLICWFSYFSFLRYIYLVINKTEKILKSYWIDINCKILEKNTITNGELGFKTICLNVYKKIKKIGRNSISTRIYFAIVKILKYSLNFLDKIGLKNQKNTLNVKIDHDFYKEKLFKKKYQNISVVTTSTKVLKKSNRFSALEVLNE
nr:CPARA_1gp147 [Cryptomonas curvata]